MAKNYRAGGQWARPWNTMDHARSSLMQARMLLRREMAPGDYPLLTADEVDVLQAIDTALLSLERITGNGN